MRVTIRALAIVCLLSGGVVPRMWAQQDSVPAAPLTDLAKTDRAKTDPAEIIRRVAAHEEENQKKRHNYTYEEKVVEKLVRQAVNRVFREYFEVSEFEQLVAGFEKGLNVNVSDMQPSMEYVNQLARVGGLKPAVQKLHGHGSPAMVASAVEFILEGLHLNKRLNKDEVKGQTRYRR
jgi:hypothetical protein